MTAPPLSLDHKLLLGRYRVVHLLGEGGMGTVYLARVEGAEGFRRPVVVKRMKRSGGSNEEGNRLFIREAQILSKLQHPAIVGISDFGIEDGAHVMVLEYVHGYTLSLWLEYRRKNQNLIPLDVCLYIVRRVLDALHYAHHFDTEEGHEIEIIHRDVSPDNVLLSNQGYVHLLDFGVASMRGPQGPKTSDSEFRGKLCYSAPETVEGTAATPRSDQYSAAVLLLELLTLSTPFQAGSIAETFVKMVQEVPAPASSVRDDVPPELDAALARALSKQPAERFDTAHAFSRELKRFQHEDDEDIAQRLKALARDEFERLPALIGVEPLKARETALQRVLSEAPPDPARAATESRPREHAEQQPETSGRSSPRSRLAESSVAASSDDIAAGADSTDPRAATTTASTPAQPPLQGLLWGLLVVGGLIALGLGAAVAMLSRTGSDQVVVVGGELPEASIPVDPSNPSTARLNQDDAPASEPSRDDGEPTREQGMTSRDDGEAVGQLDSIAPSGGVGRAQAAGAADETQAAISKAVHRQAPAFQACFAKSVRLAEATPEVVLRFSVAKEGGAPRVNVEPAAVAGTALGECLQAAARRVEFPRLERAVTFTVPVRARVSRADRTR